MNEDHGIERALPTREQRVVEELVIRGWAEVDAIAFELPVRMRSWTKKEVVFSMYVGKHGRVCGAWAHRGKAGDMVGATSEDTIGVTKDKRDKFGQAMSLLTRADRLANAGPGDPQSRTTA